MASAVRDVQVLRLGPQDFRLAEDTVRLLKSPAGYPAPTAEYALTFLSRSENVLIVAINDGEPVGYIVAYLLDRVDRNRKMMFLYEIEVSEAHRRRGIGKIMIYELKSICRIKDVVKMWVPTNRSNVAATQLYSSNGGRPFSSGDEVTYEYLRESFIGSE